MAGWARGAVAVVGAVMFVALTGCGADTAPGATEAGPTSAASGAGMKLPADGSVDPADVDTCAVLVAAVGQDALGRALGDPVVDSQTLLGNCSMSTKEYPINSAGSTSTGRLSFGVSTTSLKGTAGEGTAVEGLAESVQDANAIVWQRAPYWFSLQVLPVQKSDTDPDVIDAAVLTALAKAINENA